MSTLSTRFYLIAVGSVLPWILPAQQTVSSIFDFKADIRIFTAQALQNIAGEDHEWRKEGMHPLRSEIRRDLFRTLDSGFISKSRAFRNARDVGWDAWASYALLTNGPPSFVLSYDSKTSPYADAVVKSLPGLSPLLAEFYIKADVPRLWEKYGPRFQALNDEFCPYADRALADIIRYCRLEDDYFSRNASRIHVQFAPMQSYFTAFTDKVDNEIYLIFGPQPSKPSPSSFYHEALHHVLTPLTDKLDSIATNRFKDLFALATSDGHIGYSHIDEAFVRTLGCVLAGKLNRDADSTVLAWVTTEYKLGFILCLPIYEQLKGYEATNITFQEYFPRILTNIDVEREKLRWLELTKKAK